MHRLLAVVAGLVAAGVAGRLSAGDVTGVTVEAGEVTADGTGLHLGKGAVVGVGTGRAIGVTGRFGTGGVELVRGELVGHFGAVSGLFDAAYHTVGDTPRFPWERRDGDWLGLACEGQMRLLLARKGGQAQDVGLGPADPGCPARPLAVRAVEPVTLTGIDRDGVRVPVGVTVFSWAPAAAAGLAASLAGLVLGPGVAGTLLLLPLAFLGPRLGVPAAAVAAVVAGGAGVLARPRWAGAVLAIGGLVTAGITTVRRTTEPPAWLAQHAGAALIDADLPRRKLDDMVDRARKKLAEGPRRGRLIVALGSSSSGGSTKGRWWPQVLQELRPADEVVSISEGGATSWHARRALEALDLRPAACVSYLGQNDTNPSLPGATLAELERGATGSGGWVAPVTLADAREHYAALVSRCGLVLAMEERVTTRARELAAYREMLLGVPGVHHADAVAALSAETGTMLDDVHLTARGSEVLALFVDTELDRLIGP